MRDPQSAVSAVEPHETPFSVGPPLPLRHVRTLLLVALCIGVLWGALSCASGMAIGIGHSEHLRTAETQRSGQTGPVHVHGGQEPVRRPVEARPSTSDDLPAGREPRSGLVGQSHPGLACVVEFALCFPVPSVLATVDPITVRPLLAPPERVSGPEPPVPRSDDFV